jgi:hypothetical protein
MSDTHTKPEAMTLTQMAAKYKVCSRTIKKWIEPYLDEIGRPQRTYIFTPEQVRKIFEKIGEP